MHANPLGFLPLHTHGCLSWGLWEAPSVYSRALETAAIFAALHDLCGRLSSIVSMVTAPPIGSVNSPRAPCLWLFYSRLEKET